MDEATRRLLNPETLSAKADRLRREARARIQGEGIRAWTEHAISERERVAGDAASEAGGTWSEDPFAYGVRDEKNALVAKSRDSRASSIVHIAANDPASVLRRCAADRKLLELHGDRSHSCPATGVNGFTDEWTEFDQIDTCPVVQLLAEGYGWTGGDR
jgi:hypothetical protein